MQDSTNSRLVLGDFQRITGGCQTSSDPLITNPNCFLKSPYPAFQSNGNQKGEARSRHAASWRDGVPGQLRFFMCNFCSCQAASPTDWAKTIRVGEVSLKGCRCPVCLCLRLQFQGVARRSQIYFYAFSLDTPHGWRVLSQRWGLAMAQLDLVQFDAISQICNATCKLQLQKQ